ncbi:MATH domain and coiled-coil domain-containing protein [Cardamine amara subsp. amara]|uniref:MATH domain and coiled-coil domain-containing protein n=1 Tax=Cardamine amara subsp. amara TaxID=228776 RepID=A0ABD1C8K4_CARAN
MEKQVDKKFTWVIKNFDSLESEYIQSDQFVVGGCKWRLVAYPKGKNKDHKLSLYLKVDDYESLPSGWRRHAKFSFTIVNQSRGVNLLGDYFGRRFGLQHLFGVDLNSPCWGFPAAISLTQLNDKNGGYLKNGELKIVAEIDVLEVIGESVVSAESEDAISPLKKIKLNDDGAETSSVYWVHVLPSQVQYVRRIFEKHPDIALEFSSKNPHLRTGYMNVLLSITNKLCQSPQVLSNDDLSDAGIALAYMTDAGFKMDWLEKKLEQVKEKKKRLEASLARLQEMENSIKPLKQKYLDQEAQIKKENAELLAAKAPFSFDDLNL